MKKPHSYAFIDAQNLYLGTISQGRELDFTKFRIFLKDKRNMQKAFLCIGYKAGNESLYCKWGRGFSLFGRTLGKRKETSCACFAK